MAPAGARQRTLPQHVAKGKEPMAISEHSLQVLAQRATADPDFMKRLRTDPDGALQDAGVSLSDEDRAALTAPSASLGEALQQRIAHMGPFR
jgi:hypothetical protein